MALRMSIHSCVARSSSLGIVSPVELGRRRLHLPGMTSPPIAANRGSLRLLGTNSALPPVDAASESRLAFRARPRGRADGKVILPRPRIELFDLLDLVPHRPAHGPFLRFDHSTCGF